jgi:hypothetical protein
MNFIKVKDTRTGIEYDWMADIQSIPDLMELEEQFLSRNAWCVKDYLMSKDYADQVNMVFEGNPVSRQNRVDHCHPQNKLYHFLSASVFQFPESKKFTPMVFFAEKLDEVVKGKVKDLAKHGRILINQNGGYFYWHDGLSVLDTCKNNKFPQYALKDVKVSKWPEGTHWYITVNGCAVVVDGMEKWKSEKNAWDAAKKWVESEK